MKAVHQKNKSSLLIIATLIVIFFGCKKTESPVTPPPVVTTVTASVAGIVADINNTPVSGASVSAGTSVTTTDANGLFTIKNIQLDKDAGFVTITKPGYFEGSRTFLVSANTVNNVSIQLIPKTVSGNFDATSGGNINVSGGGSVNFTGGFVTASNGNVYTGNVSVSTFYLNPGDQNFSEYMPGNLNGISATNQKGIVQSFGMIVAEMNDASGNKLQLASGKTATITIPITAALQATAPASIPLWYYDDTERLWTQEGTATKQGNNYVGTVKHFSFWMPGQLAQSIKLNAKFVFDTSSVSFPLVNSLVTITSANFGTTDGYTDSTGTVSGLVPSNETLVMKVFNNCGDSIYEKSVGPFSADKDLGTITVTGVTCFTPPVSINLSATLKDQGGNILSGYIVSITNNAFIDTSITTGSNGQFNTTVPTNQSFVMNVYDPCGDTIYTKNIGPFTWITDLGTITISVTPPVSVTLSGTVVDCNNNAVTSGVVYANIGYRQFSSNITNGIFSIVFNRCNSSPVSATIAVYDVATQQSIPGQTITVTNSENIGQIIIPCGSFSLPDSSYINFTINGNSYSWAPPRNVTQFYDSTTRFQGGSTSDIDSATYIVAGIESPDTSAGNYPFTIYAIINGSILYNTYYPNNNPNTIVTKYDPRGGYITGTATGWIKNFPVATTDSFPLPVATT